MPLSADAADADDDITPFRAFFHFAFDIILP